MSFFNFQKIFFEAYGITDYMDFLIKASAKNERELKIFKKLHQKFVEDNNTEGIINLLIKIGKILHEIKGSTEDYLNSIFAYSFAIEKIVNPYDKIKIELSINCGKIFEIISKKEKIKITGEEYNEIHKNEYELYDLYNLNNHPKKPITYQCEYLKHSILMYSIAIDVLEYTQDDPQKLINVLLDIAKIQKNENKCTEAIATLNKCLRVSINLKTISHPDTLFIITELAFIHKLILELGQAFKYYSMVFKYQNNEGLNYTQTIQIMVTMLNLGHISFNRGNCIEAIDYYTAAFKKSVGVIEPTHKLIENILTCLATSHIYYNKPEKALKYKQLLIELGLNTRIIDDDYKKYNLCQKFCSCCFEIKEKLFLCSGCRKVHYCNQEHQIKDWSNHKSFCLQEKATKIKLESLKPKLMALTQTPHNTPIFETMFYIKNRSLYKRASKGDLYSIYEFGCLCYDNSHFVEAFKWFSKLAVRGHIYGEYYIGLSYLYGYGINKNINEAIKWLLLAANKYHPEAQCELGILYLDINNTSEGVGWVKLAAAQKQVKALKMLKKIDVDT